MSLPTVRFRILDDRAIVPTRGSEQAAGLDLAACFPIDQALLTLEPGQIAIVPTGLAIAIPDGYEGQVRPRSGLATKRGITVPNAPGTIDADYRGELRVALINLSKERQTIHHGDRIAQLVIAAVAMCEVVVVDDLDETVRGVGGFGSTGVASGAR